MKTEWTAGEKLKAGKQNVINAPLVDQTNVAFPQLQNQTWFNKAYNRDGVLIKDGDSFSNICDSYPSLSDEKKKAGVFDGP